MFGGLSETTTTNESTGSWFLRVVCSLLGYSNIDELKLYEYSDQSWALFFELFGLLVLTFFQVPSQGFFFWDTYLRKIRKKSKIRKIYATNASYAVCTCNVNKSSIQLHKIY